MPRSRTFSPHAPIRDLLILAVVVAAGLAATPAVAQLSPGASAPQALPALGPAAPAGLAVTGSTASSITISWQASTSVTTVGYGVYRDGSLTASTSATSYSFAGLSCGTTYRLGVDAVDVLGNRSETATIAAATLPCPDAQPPSAPADVRAAVQTDSSVTIAWSPSGDDVGVSGYGYYRGGSLVGNGTGTSYTFTGLACGTSYTFAVDAYDAAGNRSSRSSLTAATSACTPTPPPPATGTGANLWVDTNGGSCLRSTTASAYADGSACGSLNAAYQAAANGDTIRVRGGSYPGQTIAQKDAAAAPGITILNASGENVEYASLTVKGSFVRVGGFLTHNLSVDGAGNNAVNRPVEEVVVENFEVDGLNRDGSPIGYLRGVRALTWRNGEIHSNKNMSLVLADQDASAGALNQISFDRMTFHDALLDASSSAHTECLYAQGINNLRITNSHFYRCAVMDVFITRWSGTNTDAVGGYVENSIFEAPLAAGNVCCAANAFHFRNGGEPAPDIDNWDFRYNLFAGTLSLGGAENAVKGGGLRVVGNTFLSSSTCKAGATWTANVHSDGSTCGGSGETTASSATIRSGYAGYVDSTAPNNNWRLTPTSVLIDKGTNTTYPGLDRDGNTRYTGNAPDAGPYEHRP
jgi:chitodextrinase